MDRIFVRNLVCQARIGVGGRERSRPQPLEIDVELGFDLSVAARTDAIADTVDYTRVADRVRALVEASDCHLLEALAGRIADALLVAHDAGEVRVELRKIGVPEAGPAARCGVSLIRRRSVSPSAPGVAAGGAPS